MDFERIDYEITDSTNTRAKEFARARGEGERRAAVFVARHQTAGRGRLGRSFHSPEGEGIYMSFLIYPDGSAQDATAMTAYAAVKACRALARFTDADVRIKWVNDLILGGRKLAGILTEGEIRPDGALAYMVCGIGINLYKTERPDGLGAIATSIEEETGLRLDREAVILALIEEFLDGLDPTGDGILGEYRDRSAVIGREVRVIGAGGEYEATAVGILDDYSLLVERESGVRERVFTGEISIRLI